MCARRIEFSGPVLRPWRKWLVGFGILSLYASFLAFGVAHGLPKWLQDLGWALSLLFLLGGSVCLVWLSCKEGRAKFGRLSILPKSWARWILDESESTKRP